MAAHLDGRGCSALDFTGLSQKNGAVMSHVRIAAAPEDLATVRIASGGADLILGCDIVVSANATALNRVERGATLAVVNADIFVGNIGRIDDIRLARIRQNLSKWIQST
jgi:indolepyruvate ferredoxin oxidoreductase